MAIYKILRRNVPALRAGRHVLIWMTLAILACSAYAASAPASASSRAVLIVVSQPGGALQLARGMWFSLVRASKVRQVPILVYHWSRPLERGYCLSSLGIRADQLPVVAAVDVAKDSILPRRVKARVDRASRNGSGLGSVLAAVGAGPTGGTPEVGAKTRLTAPWPQAVRCSRDGSQLYLIPSGPFLMGSHRSDVDWALTVDRRYDPMSQRRYFSDQLPCRSKSLNAFYMARFPVTVRDFAAFVRATGYQTDAERHKSAWVWTKFSQPMMWTGKTGWRTPPHGVTAVPGGLHRHGWLINPAANWRVPDGRHVAAGDEPVVQVSWEDAQAYCRWAGLCLPSEAQWEKAARGTDGRRYPWGSTFTQADRARFGYLTSEFSRVGSHPLSASPYGCEDLVGSVWQWTATPDSRGGKSVRYVIRGGSWITASPAYLTCEFRGWGTPEHTNDQTGFRCAWCAISRK